MHPTDKAARVAGAVYSSMVFTAPFSLIYVPNKLIVRGDATATAANILAHETLFRLSIFTDLVGHVIFICLAIALHHRFVRRVAPQSAFQQRCTVQRQAIRDMRRGGAAFGLHRYQRIWTGAWIMG